MAEAGRGGGEERIGELQRTWEESPSPRVGLQLAEEYRRAGRLADARAVLERSLESHTGHLSSLVALGKTQLDLDEPDAAAGRFETVLERDPTHLVAGKLLIEAHLRRGDGAGARLRLEHYRLLNAGDPELDDLERRTVELEGAESAATPPAGVGEEVEAGEEAEATEAEAAQEVEAAETEGAEGIETAAGETGSHASIEHGAGDPFGPLTEAADERRWLAGLAAPGIFPVELPPEPEPPVTAEEPAAPAEPEEDAAVAAEPEGEQPVPVAAQPEPQAPPAVTELAEEEQEEQEEPPAVPREPGGRATSTLGELYLAQGHLEDAERVFRTVLARRPDDAAAHAGLAEVARRRRGPFDAAALMRWAADRGRPVTGGDRTARSAALVRTYRDRLHREGRRDVP